MLSMDLSRAAMVFAIPFVRALWWVYLWGFLIEVASIVFLPARDLDSRSRRRRRRPSLANGLVLGRRTAASPSARRCCGGRRATRAVRQPAIRAGVSDGRRHLRGVVPVSRLTQLGPSVTNVADDSDGDGGSDGDLRFRDAFAIPLVAAVMPAALAVSLGLGALFSASSSCTTCCASGAEFGVLVALFGVGAVVGLVALPAVAPRRPPRARAWVSRSSDS
jgi:hypothetical protein